MLKYPSIDPVFLKLGPLEFRWHGLAYILGLLLPFIIFKKEFVTRFGMNADDRSNPMLSLLFGILIGGRIGYVLIYDFADFIVSPLSYFLSIKGVCLITEVQLGPWLAWSVMGILQNVIFSNF